MTTTVTTAKAENLAPKAVVIDSLKQLAQSSPVAIAMEYRGLVANDIAELRRDARAAGVTVRIAKNTLVKRAFIDTPYASMGEGMTGPLMLLFSSSDNVPGAAGICRDYAAKHDFLQVRLLSLQGRQLDVSETARIANLPTHDIAIAQLLGIMLAPVGQLARLLKMPMVQFLIVLGEVRKQKENV
ncbi:MAG: 50S ribosomal protein L10 [Candidatus Porifericomitaceae bacterium WSBS_2022_MAG_OTU9]